MKQDWAVADMLLGYYTDAAVFQPGGFGVGGAGPAILASSN